MLYNYDNIPFELKQEKRWVLWKLKDNTKIPINAKTGFGAKSNDNKTWSSFEFCLKVCDTYKCNGLGFMLGNGFFGVDIDNHDESNIEDLKNEFIETLKSYTEYSQSGKGIHIICKGVLPSGMRRKGNIEMYDSVRFFALTGKQIGNYGISDRTNEIKELYNKYLLQNKPIYTFKEEINTTTKELTDDEVIRKINESRNANLFNCLYYGSWEGIYKSQSEADLGLCNILAFWCGKNKYQIDRIFRNSQLFRDKWDEKRGDLTYGEITINKAIESVKNIYQGESANKVFNAFTGELESEKEYELNDTGNAERFIDIFGDKIKYNVDNKTWMIYDGIKWKIDEKEEIKKLVDIMIYQMKDNAIKYENDKSRLNEKLRNIKHLSSNNGKNAMLKEAQHIKETSVKNCDFDKEWYFLNTLNGIIDLRNGEILEHDKKYMISKCTSTKIDLKNEPKLWLNTLNEIFEEDTDLIDYIHKALGYSITGLTREQCLFQLTGVGGNGKSVFLNTLYEILGTYTLNMQIDSILTKNNSSSSNANSDIARLNGVRLVRTNEPNENARFNEGLVKQMTGGDVITARFLYGKEFDFKPIFKLWIACNSKIIVRGTDRGIWRRMRVINFNRVFDENTADKDLEEKLTKEYPQILGWLVKGTIEYLKNGLGSNEKVDQATKEYKNEMDVLQMFVSECLISDSKSKESSKDLYDKYKKWALNGNEWVMTQTKFSIEMKKRFKKINIAGSPYFLGVKIKTGYTYVE